ncbi:hypothetical protein J120_02495 [candidate division TM6 bacterium JCVI TM6SC1]|uniref:BAX inhibitor (BI)-1/YccA family protein n=1 Tax=candidate division TM6 bacterium JCVI TM6SC1 TaxID=1306947 RepID=A0A0D2GPP2_9BACT|nr:hypothetical protein J120_02495 [candidate division TM6 bacterium JCVI TM6SC1]
MLSSNTISNLMYRVYGWMSMALAMTAATAYYVAHQPQLLMAIFSSPAITVTLALLQFGLVIGLSMLLPRISFTTALVMFVAYAVVTGLFLSSIFILYTYSSIYTTFLITGGMFGVMSLYGYFTKSDLTGLGNILFMALIGLIISTVVNIFVQSSGFETLLSAFGVIIFTLLTAYDVQRIKRIAMGMLANETALSQIALFGALQLYLDFINLFLYLLRFMGRRRN